MEHTLSQLTDIISGHSFRGAVPTNESGFYKVIQVRDIDDIYLDSTLIETTSDVDNAMVQEGDILLSMRGTDSSGLKVTMVTDQTEPCIVSSALCILRATSGAVLPEYLLFYLNSTRGQQRLKSLLAGATVKTIVKKELAKLQISIPPMDKQKQVVEMSKNVYRQKQLLSQKNNLLATLADNIVSTHI